MRSVFAAIRTLTLPYGVTHGTRIVLDGVNGRILIYDAADNLIGNIAPQGPDKVVIQALSPSGAQAYLEASPAAAFLVMKPPDWPTHTLSLGDVLADVDTGAGIPFIVTQSPTVDGLANSRLFVRGETTLGGAPAVVIDSSTHAQVWFRLNAHEAPQGFRGQDSQTSDTGGIAAETTVLTISNYVFRDGRAYKATFGHGVFGAAGGEEAVFRLRKTNAAGTLYGEGGRIMTNAALQTYKAEGHWFLRRPLGTGDMTTDVVLTLQGLAGNVAQRGTAQLPRHLVLEDTGAAGDYANAVTV